MDQQERNRRRRHAGQPRGLAERLGPMLVQPLAHLERQCAHTGVVEVRRQAQPLEVRRAIDSLVLLGDVACVLDADLDLFDHGLGEDWPQLGVQGTARHRLLRLRDFGDAGDLIEADTRPPQQIDQPVLVFERFAEQVQRRF